MWASKQVERALFRWDDWKQSIVRQWADIDVELETYSLGQLRNLAIDRLRVLGLEPTLQFQIYWLSCVASDYCFNDSQSYKRICIPAWLHSRFRVVMDLASMPPENNDILPLKINSRVLPPEANIEPKVMPQRYFEEVKRDIFPISFADNDKDVVRWWEEGSCFSLNSKHELYAILKRHKGRPREKRVKQGTPAQFSDRIAIKCAVLRYNNQMTITGIAGKLHLHISHPEMSDRSDITRHLISRGMELLASLGIILDIQKNSNGQTI
jgi:hypothetical protein